MRQFLPNPSGARRRTELVLHLADGTPWRLLMSPGTERFIGAYPRIGGMEGGGPLLSFRSVAAASC